MIGRPRLMAVTGEVSGDMHAAGVIEILRQRQPDLVCEGTGGDAMRAAGVKILHDVGDMAVVGGTEAAAKFMRLRRIFYDLVGRMRADPPDLVLLVDYPGFNLRLAERAHALGIRTVYYICPQVWAWRRARIGRMARCLDRLITIFPFEPALFAATPLRADFAGHPLTDEARRILREPPPVLPWHGGAPKIALLPGSRPQEIGRLMPVLWRAAALFESRHPGSAFLIATVTETDAAAMRDFLAALPEAGPKRWSIVAGRARQVMRQADAAIVASGTATLEAAFMECPTVVTYRAGRITFALGRRLVRLPHIGIVNILAGREVCPELLQDACRAERIVEALAPLVFPTPQRERMRREMRAVVATLGEGDAYRRAAAIVAGELPHAQIDGPVQK